MEHDEQEEDEENKHNGGEVVQAGNPSEKLRKKESGRKAEGKGRHPRKEPEDRILLSESSLSNQLKGKKKQQNAEASDDDLKFDQHGSPSPSRHNGQ